MRKIISFILSVILLTGTLSSSLSAYAVGTARIECADAVCKQGEQVTVEVMLKDNPGMCFLSMTPVCYDANNNKVTDISISVSNGTVFAMTNGRNPVWDSDEDITTNGILCYLTLTVSSETPVGEYTISFIPRGCYNYDEEDVDISIVAGKLNITGDATVTSIIEHYKEQIRFGKNDDGTYSNIFDYRYLSKIPTDRFMDTFGDEENAIKSIKDIGFVFTRDDIAFDVNTAKNLVENNTAAEGYVKQPINYISTAYGDYTFSCVVTGIPDAEKSGGINAVAYIVYEKDGMTYYVYYEDVVSHSFESLYNQYYPQAFPS